MTATVASSSAASADAVLNLLRRIGQPVAPHVAMRLAAALSDDAHAIAQVAASLSPSQRAGHTALPDPLPLVRAVADALPGAWEGLDAASRRLLLMASVSVDRRVDVVLAASGLSMPELLESDAAPHVVVAAGRVAFADPRTRILVHDTASLAERTQVHAALAEAYRDAGDDRLAVWHTSLSTLEGDPALVAPLLELASTARRSGAAEWAHAVAREAASHSSGRDRLLAHLIAGEAALDAGLVEDAVTWLREPASSGDDLSARALPAFVVALTLSEGSVPDGDLSHHVGRAGRDSAEAEPIARALAIAAGLHAERGHADEADEVLTLAERVGAGDGRCAERAALGRAWAALFRNDLGAATPRAESGSVEAADDPAVRRARGDDAPGRCTADTLERIVHAIELARDGHHEQALGVLQGRAGSTMGASAPWFSDLSNAHPGPLIEAYRRVAIALVEFWSGDLSRARRGLAEASLVAPIGLPFAGLGVALARRLDVCTDGTPLPTSVALEDTHPTPNTRPLRGGVLVDRAIAAYLGGRVTEAGTLLSLATDASPSPVAVELPLPGLDETAVWALAGRADEARRAAARLEAAAQRMSPLHRRVVVARTRVLTAASADEVAAAARSAAEACRSLSSPYERARTEMVLGRARAAHGDLEAARAHLLAASGLFDAAGAAVWREACDADLDLLPAESPVSVLTQPLPLAAVRQAAASAPFTPDEVSQSVEERCRAAWRDTLTERELDVALLVSQGHSNREVAHRLFVSVRTVEVHLGRIFTKLGVPSRVALTVLAHREARAYAPVAARA